MTKRKSGELAKSIISHVKKCDALDQETCDARTGCEWDDSVGRCEESMEERDGRLVPTSPRSKKPVRLKITHKKERHDRFGYDWNDEVSYERYPNLAAAIAAAKKKYRSSSETSMRQIEACANDRQCVWKVLHGPRATPPKDIADDLLRDSVFRYLLPIITVPGHPRVTSDIADIRQDLILRTYKLLHI